VLKYYNKYKDEIIYFSLLFISISVSVYYDLFDMFHDYTRTFEEVEMDEWFIALIPISGLTIWYALRKIERNTILTKELEKSNRIDMITSLPNRLAFRETYDEHKNRDDFLFIINVINFKDINHSFGISIGDEVIKKIALKLQKIVFDLTKQKLFRVYGDEFSFFYQGSEDSAKVMAQAIKQLFEKENIHIADNVDLQIDIAISYSNIQPKFQTALFAMQTLKNSTDKTIMRYKEDLNYQDRSNKNLETLKLLKEAREKNLFTPFYQAIVDNKTEKTVKYETLIRIQKNGQTFYPNEFLDISKKYKYYYNITKAVIQKSFELFEDREESFSINLSSMDISNETVLNYLFETIEANPQTASRLIVELVESEHIDFTEKLLSFRRRLKSYGVELAIDDFGSGYSNMINILQLQPEYIKIDGSLVQELQNNPAYYSFVETIVSFAHKNNIKTIAEYVSSKEIFEVVQKLGIDFSQGYYFAKPEIKPQ